MKYTQNYLDDIRQASLSVSDIEELYGKCILITGATGMIGSALADFFIQLNRECGANIMICVSSRSEDKIKSRFEEYSNDEHLKYIPYGSLADSDINYDYVIHTAAPANPREYGSHPVETMVNIISGTDSVLKMCVRNSVRKVIYVSSSEVYGQKDGIEPYHENEYGYVDILKSRSCYPVAKRAAETLCASYIDEYGLQIIIVRPGHIYGPSMTDSDSRVAADFVRLAAAGKDIIMKSTGEQLRSHCYTVDCAAAILTALVKGESGQAYNISNENSLSTIREYAETVCKLTGVQLIFDLPSEKEKKAFNPMKNASLDGSLLEDLGWQGRFSLTTGIKHTVEAVKYNG